MLYGSRRRFLAVTGAALLYGARSAFATEAASVSQPRVALLLPLNAAAFARVAESVRQGFATAAQQDTGGPLDVMVYSTTDSAANVAIAYEQAIAEGARLIVGPLTRTGVSALLARAQRGTLVFVEVRSRAGRSHGGAAESITAQKRRRLLAAAQLYLRETAPDTPCRFDVLLLQADAPIEWLRDAITAD